MKKRESVVPPSPSARAKINFLACTGALDHGGTSAVTILLRRYLYSEVCMAKTSDIQNPFTHFLYYSSNLYSALIESTPLLDVLNVKHARLHRSISYDLRLLIRTRPPSLSFRVASLFIETPGPRSLVIITRIKSLKHLTSLAEYHTGLKRCHSHLIIFTTHISLPFSQSLRSAPSVQHRRSPLLAHPLCLNRICNLNPRPARCRGYPYCHCLASLLRFSLPRSPLLHSMRGM